MVEILLSAGYSFEEAEIYRECQHEDYDYFCLSNAVMRQGIINQEEIC